MVCVTNKKFKLPLHEEMSAHSFRIAPSEVKLALYKVYLYFAMDRAKMSSERQLELYQEYLVNDALVEAYDPELTTADIPDKMKKSLSPSLYLGYAGKQIPRNEQRVLGLLSEI